MREGGEEVFNTEKETGGMLSEMYSEIFELPQTD